MIKKDCAYLSQPKLVHALHFKSLTESLDALRSFCELFPDVLTLGPTMTPSHSFLPLHVTVDVKNKGRVTLYEGEYLIVKGTDAVVCTEKYFSNNYVKQT